MKYTYIILLALLSVQACKTKDETTGNSEGVPGEEVMQWKENDTLRLAAQPMGLNTWLSYYQESDLRFRLGNFKASGVVLHFGDLPELSGKQRDKATEQYFIYSPDSSRYIDLFSYDHFADKGMLADGEADQEVVLADTNKRLRKQLLFNGPFQSADFADWLGRDRFLLGVTTMSEDGKTLGAQLLLFNISDSTYTNFDLDHRLPIDSIKAGPQSFEEIYLNKFNLK